ncbi:hypothetical protein Rsub_09160 [Raphidocelis subcapitata]|uniref:Uncharacterized protein n=1 Tax=Raphidocelis subcapitata TaxID=307507 RepID=A0A2V0PH95_9CHLO|nr:hypothetical protein Rsub_09160 [Raphidocelis subcapitata]|eukprot:GBF96577.1 hypothetical protein Rsub_09160 [Raphidocelis subcapitata]
MAQRPVEIPFEALVDPRSDLAALIQEGFGPDGLGIVTVSGVPDFPALRERLLPLTAALAALPDDAKAALEDAASNYNVGWSHGKEALVGGRLDTLKGSFYANPTRDTYDDRAASDVEQYRDYYTPNLWPREQLPELEPALKALGCLMVSVGYLLADRCTAYVNAQLVASGAAAAAAAAAAGAGADAAPSPGAGAGGDQRRGGAGSGCVDFGAALRESACHRARLLHYFPPAPAGGGGGGGGCDGDVDWCGWHYDHGALTALTCAMYLDASGRAVPNPDPSGGLYIKDRAGRTVQAAIPPGHIAFQMGQAMAIQSGGLLHATPHYVRAARPHLAPSISRNTFAVFLQPDTNFEMRPPRGLGSHGLGILGAGGGGGAAASPSKLTAAEASGWRPGMSFGAFAAAVMGTYYDAARRQERERERERARQVLVHAEAE